MSTVQLVRTVFPPSESATIEAGLPNPSETKPETIRYPSFSLQVPVEVVRKTAAALNLSMNSPGWGISDYNAEAGLVNVRYITMDDQKRCKPGDRINMKAAQPGSYSWLRGTVVDLASGAIVCQSYPHTPRATVKTLTMTNSEVFNEKGQEERKEKLAFHVETHGKLAFSNFTFWKGEEGIVIRIFKIRNEVFFTTHRRLSIERHRRCSLDKSTLDLYYEMGGPKPDVLFSEAENSPFVHMFIICHSSLVMTTREDLGEGYSVYLGYNRMTWEHRSPCPFPGLVEETPYFVQTEEALKPNTPRIISPKRLSWDEACAHIQGKLPDPRMDPRLSNGGFIIARCSNDGEKRLSDNPDNVLYSRYFRLQGNAQAWRDDVVDDNDNVINQYCQLLDRARSLYLSDKYNRSQKQSGQPPKAKPAWLPDAQSYHGVFPRVAIPSNVDKLPIIYSNGPPTPIKDLRTREFHVLTCLLLAVPLAAQRDVIKARDYLLETRNYVQQAAEEFIEHLPLANPPRLGDTFKRLRRELDDPKLVGEEQYSDYVLNSIRRLSYARFYKIRKEVEKERRREAVLKQKREEERKAAEESKLVVLNSVDGIPDDLEHFNWADLPEPTEEELALGRARLEELLAPVRIEEPIPESPPTEVELNIPPKEIPKRKSRVRRRGKANAQPKVTPTPTPKPQPKPEPDSEFTTVAPRSRRRGQRQAAVM